MKSLWARRLVLVAGLGGLGCNGQSVAPPGSVSGASIRVYVDADGSGGFNSGDIAVAGMNVTLAGSGADPIVAPTDAEGYALFPAVPAGTWVATVEGTPPAGAILSTAARLTIEAPYEGGVLAAEFRFVYQPGSLSGVVYRDDDANGVFTPGTDFPATGAAVDLFAGTDTTAEPLAEALTDGTGAFTIDRVRPGNYTLRITPPFPTMAIVGGPVHAVTVLPDAPATFDATFTGTAILSVTDAKASPGSVVTIEGTVSVAPLTFRTQGDNLYMQDATGGLQVFDVTPGSGLQVGDNIRVTGLMGAFSGEQQIVRIDATTLPTVLLLGAGTPPTPRTVTAADIVARTYEGQLVTISDAVLGTIPGGTAAAYNLPFTAPPNVAFTVRIEAGVGATVTRGSWTSGATYSVTGVLGSFNGTAQLKPRGAGDIVFGAPPVLSIATAKARPAGDTVTVAGVVTVPQGAFRTQGDNIYLQDNTAGMQIFDVDPALGLVVGDSIRVRGLMGAFNGEVQMVRFDAVTRPTVIDLGTGTTPAPRVVTVAEIIARTFEGQLVRITDAVLVTVGGGTGASYNNTFQVGGTNFTVRIEAGVGASVLRASWTVGNTYTITGVLGSFTGTAQLKPRGTADIVLQ
jgi:hypothetical protein